MHARENGAVAPLILYFGDRWKSVINFRPPHPGRFTDVKEPRYPLNKGLRGGLRAGLGDLDSNPGPSVPYSTAYFNTKETSQFVTQ